MTNAASSSAALGACGLPVAAEAEPKKTEAQQSAEEVESLKLNIQASLRKYQDIQTNGAIMLAKASTTEAEQVNKFLKVFKESLASLDAKLGKLIPALKKMVTVPVGYEIDTQQVMKVLKAMKQVDDIYAECEEYAPKFGCNMAPIGKTRGQKRSRKQEEPS
jgi:hypothetical protein